MNKKELHYLTHKGKSYQIDPESKIRGNKTIDNWKSMKRDHYNVLTVKIFDKDFEASDYVRKVFDTKHNKKKRGQVKRLSFGSVRRLKFVLRNIIHEMNYEVGLTYPNEFPNDGLAVKDHLHKLRMRLAYRGYKSIWVLEFQGRGAPHFHMLLDKEIELEKLLKMWYAIVGSGDTKHLRHGAHVNKIRTKEGMRHYFASYLTKQDQKTVPEAYHNVGRFWGYTLSLLSCTIKKYYGNEDDIRELKGQLRPMRKWYAAQKRRWTNQKSTVAKKFQKNPHLNHRGSKIKVVNSDKFINELKQRGIDTELFDKGVGFVPEIKTEEEIALQRPSAVQSNLFS